MTVGMMAEEYMAKFEMLAGTTGFNDMTLEDAYIRGLSHLILLKVYSQTTLLSRLNKSKTVIHNLDWLVFIICPSPLSSDHICHPDPRHVCPHGHQQECTSARDPQMF